MNSQLYDKTYTIPSNIIDQLAMKLEEYKDSVDGDAKGVKRAKTFVKNRTITYQDLKRMKNYFDHLQGDDYKSLEYQFNGGELMNKYVENILELERRRVEQSKKVKSELGGMENQYIKPHEVNDLKVNTETNFITNESLIREIEEDEKFLTVSLAVIVNNDYEILLLKRSEGDSWGAGMWALVGGKIDKGETPEQALVREVQEECGFTIDKFKYKKIITYGKTLQYLYVAKVESPEVEINDEHSDYGWFSVEDIKKLENKVPKLIEYIKLITK